MAPPRIAYLEDAAFLESHIGWLLRKADRLKRMAPRLKNESQRQECLRAIDVLLDRAEDLVRDAIQSLPDPLILEDGDAAKPALNTASSSSATKSWADFVIKSALL